MLEEIIKKFPDDEFLTADGFTEAIIGVEWPSMRIVYSMAECIKILTVDMSVEDALDHYYYNVSGAYVGEKTPIWREDY